MEEEIKIGEEVLSYIGRLGEIQGELEEAYSYARKCLGNLSEGAYEGQAREEMELFFCSLESHLQRMMLLYQAAASYIATAYQTMYYNEEQLVDWVIGQLGED